MLKTINFIHLTVLTEQTNSMIREIETISVCPGARYKLWMYELTKKNDTYWHRYV